MTILRNLVSKLETKVSKKISFGDIGTEMNLGTINVSCFLNKEVLFRVYEYPYGWTVYYSLGNADRAQVLDTVEETYGFSLALIQVKLLLNEERGRHEQAKKD